MTNHSKSQIGSFYHKKKHRHKHKTIIQGKARPEIKHKNSDRKSQNGVSFPLAVLLHLTTTTARALAASTPIPTAFNLRPSDYFTVDLNKQIPNLTQASVTFPGSNLTQNQENSQNSTISIQTKFQGEYVIDVANDSDFYKKYVGFSTNWEDTSNTVWVALVASGKWMSYTAAVQIDKKYKNTKNWFRVLGKWKQLIDSKRKPQLFRNSEQTKIIRFDYMSNIKSRVSTGILDFYNPYKKGDYTRRVMPLVSVYTYKSGKNTFSTKYFPLYFGIKSEDALIDDRLRVSFSPLDPNDSKSDKNFILTYNYIDGSVFRTLRCYQTYKFTVDYNKGDLMNCVVYPHPSRRRVLEEGKEPLKDPKESEEAHRGSEELQGQQESLGEGTKPTIDDYFKFLSAKRLDDILSGQVSFTAFAVGHGFICNFVSKAPFDKCVPVFMLLRIIERTSPPIYRVTLEVHFANPASFQYLPYGTIKSIYRPVSLFTMKEILYSTARIGNFSVFSTTAPTLLIMSTKRFYVYKFVSDDAATTIQKLDLQTKSDNIECPSVPGVDVGRLFPLLEFQKDYFLAKYVDREVDSQSPYRIRFLVNFTKIEGSSDFKADCKVFTVNQVITLNQGGLLIFNQSQLRIPSAGDKEFFRMKINGLSEDNSDQEINAQFNYSSRVPNENGEMVDQAGSQQISLKSNTTPFLDLPVREFDVIQPDSLAISFIKAGVLGRFPSVDVPHSLNPGGFVLEENLNFLDKNQQKMGSLSILRYIMVPDSNFEVVVTAERAQNPQNITLMIFKCSYPDYHQRVCKLKISYRITNFADLQKKEISFSGLILGGGTHLAVISENKVIENASLAIEIYGVNNLSATSAKSENFGSLYQDIAYTLSPANPYQILFYGISKQVNNSIYKPGSRILIGMQKLNFNPLTGSFGVSAGQTIYTIYAAPLSFIEGISMAPSPPETTKSVQIMVKHTEIATAKNTTSREGMMIQQIHICVIDVLMNGTDKPNCFRKDLTFRERLFGKRPLISCPTLSSHFVQSALSRLNSSRLFVRQKTFLGSNSEVLRGMNNLKILSTFCLGAADIVQLDVYDFAKNQRQLLYLNADSRILEKRQREAFRAVIDQTTTKVYTNAFKALGFIRAVTLRPGDTLATLKTLKINTNNFTALINSSSLDPNKKTAVKITLTSDGQKHTTPIEYPITVSVTGQKIEEFQISAKTATEIKTPAPRIMLNEPIDLEEFLNLSGMIADLELTAILDLKNGENAFEFRSRKYRASGVSTAPLIAGDLSGGENEFIDNEDDDKESSRPALTAKNEQKSTFVYIKKIQTVGDWMMAHYETEAGIEGIGLSYEPKKFIEDDNGKKEQKSSFEVSFPLSFEKQQNLELISFYATEDNYNSDEDNKHVYFAIHYKQTKKRKNPKNRGLEGTDEQEETGSEQIDKPGATRYLIKVYRSELTRNSKKAKMRFLVRFFTKEKLEDDHFGIVPMSKKSFYLTMISAEYDRFKLAYLTPNPNTSKYSQKTAIISDGRFRRQPSFLEFHNKAYRDDKGEIVQTLVGIYGSFHKGYLSVVWAFPESTEIYYSRWFTLSIDLILQVVKMSCKEEVGGHQPKIAKKHFEIDFQCYVAAVGSFDYLMNYTVTLEQRYDFPQVYRRSKVVSKLITPDFFYEQEMQHTGDVIVMKMANLNPDVEIDESIASKCPYILTVYRTNISTFPWAIYSCKDLGIQSKEDIPSFSLYKYDNVYIWVASRTNFLKKVNNGRNGLQLPLEPTRTDEGGKRAQRVLKNHIQTKSAKKSKNVKNEKKPKNLEFGINLDGSESKGDHKGLKSEEKTYLNAAETLVSEISVHTIKNATLIIKSPSFTFKNASLTLKRLNQNKMLRNLGMLTSICMTPFIITFSVSPFVLYPIMALVIIFVVYFMIVKDLRKQKILKFLFATGTVYVDQGEAERSHKERERQIERSLTMKKVFGAVWKGMLADVEEKAREDLGAVEEEEEEDLNGMSEDEASESEQSSQNSQTEEGGVRVGIRYNFEDRDSSDDEMDGRYKQRKSYAEFVLR